MKHIFVTICLFGAFTLFFGCTCTDQRFAAVEKNWGKAHETARYIQIVNPDADHDPMEGTDLDGVAADYNVKEYRKAFKEEEQASQVFNISF